MEMKLCGRMIYGKYTAVRHKPGMRFNYAIYVPPCTNPDGSYAVAIDHDGLPDANCAALDYLAERGEAPWTVVFGLCSASLPASVEGGTERGMRFNNYDLYSPEYADLVVDEMIPALAAEHRLTLSPSPDMHMAMGGSSGGISAWCIAWFRTDYVRRVYMASPSFLSMAHGREFPALMRKVETKPIRVYTDYSETEPNDYFGSSHVAGMEAERALKFAGYDMDCAYYPGEGHCARCNDYETNLKVYRFLWKNWKTEPVRPGGLSTRMEKLISHEEPWRVTDEPMPEAVGAVSDGKFTAAGEYIARGGLVIFRTPDGSERTVASGFDDISALAISSDRWRLYIGDRRRGSLYAMSIAPDGSLSCKSLHAALHLPIDFRCPGAYDLCADSTDRIFAATEMGIQCVRSFGIIDVILPLPGERVPERVALGGEDGAYLYAQAGDVVYRRRMLQGSRQDPHVQSEPLGRAYYD